DRRDERWHATPPRVRRHERDGMGGGARLRRAGAGVRGADRVKAALFEQLRADPLAKRPGGLMTRLPDGAQRLPGPHGAVPDDVTPPLFDAARLAAARDEASTVEEDGGTIFLQPFNPPLRLIIVGAVHIAQALARMGALAGFAAVVVDPRSAF